MKYRNTILVFFAAFLFSTFSMAQTGNIRGHVYDDATGEPVIFANVVVDGTTFGTNTNESGLFTLTAVPLGNYKLKVSYIGYEDILIDVEFKATSINYYKVNITASGVNLGVVDISAQRQVARTEVRISEIQVSKKEIKALPSTGGDADILQYLQVLPGVISTGDQGGQLYIRGGSPVQNKILLDGLTIYNPFHSIGFYSSFETELIRNVDVLTGAFNAEHGGRISAVIDISTREGNKKRFGGQVSASPFMVKGLFEGPLAKLKDDQGSLSLVLTTKRSIIESTSKDLYNYAAVNDSIGLPFSFNDTYGKLSFVTANGSSFNFFGFNFDDSYNNPLVARIDWTNSGGGLNFSLLPATSNLNLNGLVGFSQYETSIIEADEDPRESVIREYVLGLDFNYFFNNAQLDYGIEVKSIRTEFEFTNPFGVSLNQFQNTTEVSGFLKFRQSWDKLVIEPGFRMQYYASLGEFSPEPRLGLKYNITDATRFKLAAGLYSQNLIAASNERDVVNLFNGFLSGPDNQFDGYDGEPVDSKLQKAAHVVVGVEQDMGDHFELNVEAYVKDFSQLVVINRNKTNRGQSDYSTEEGEAYGIDFTLKYKKKNLYVWGTYSLGKVTRFDGEQEYPTIFDRRHNVNLLATYTFGHNNDWMVSARWNFGTGFPFTKTQGFYTDISFLDGVNTDYLTQNPENVGIIYSDERNGGRLPSYHRLDISVQKNIEFSKYMNAEIVLSASNTYNRDNIFYFDRLRFERVDQLPIIPALAVRFNF
ncbi:MAG: TonB-dependent receptor [Saprospiraceae bacterium]|nr:TonB-dependent receptor [Saprospiraceae bacterium]